MTPAARKARVALPPPQPSRAQLRLPRVPQGGKSSAAQGPWLSAAPSKEGQWGEQRLKEKNQLIPAWIFSAAVIFAEAAQMVKTLVMQRLRRVAGKVGGARGLGSQTLSVQSWQRAER